MKTLSAYVVDAFAKEVFHGNPAAVVPLDSWLPIEIMQSIAAEHNLAETVFFVKTAPGHYHIRWFTPVEEMDLCGHATVASAFVIEQFLEPGLSAIEFSSMSGPLGVAIADGIYTLDFPSRPPVETIKHALLLPGMRESPEEILGSKRDYFLVYENAEQIRDLDPEYSHLAKLDRIGVIATAIGDEPGVDFVSRFFAPKTGINEDPVTGSAHSTLIPFWAGRLGKTKLFAQQISPRHGDLYCELVGDRVKIGGHAVLYSKSEIYIPGL